MARSRTPDVLSSPDRRAVREFLAATLPNGCARFSGASPDPAAIAEAAAAHDTALIGYAQVATGDDGYTIDCVADDSAVREQLVRTLIADLPADSDVTWWGHDSPTDAALADSLLMPPPHRRLINMRRALPLDLNASTAGPEVHLRPFVVGSDEQAWLDVNNSAFSWHGEQGDWDLATLRQRMSEPWFDPAGFLLHERDGRLAGFCWTKVHPHSTGEIFVIAVHPDFHGLGLGRALTVAGLRHLSDIGSNVAMLYVEADNIAAVRLYESLGFHTEHTDFAFQRVTNSGDTQ